MKILFATHALRGYPQRKGGFPAPELRQNLFAWAKRKGFDGIEVGDWWFDFYSAEMGEIARLKEEMEGYGLEMAGLNCLRKCVTHPAVADQNRCDLHRAIEVAKALRLSFVSISLALVPTATGTPEDRIKGLQVSPGGGKGAPESEFVETAVFLAELASDASSADVEVAIELHHCGLADTSQRILHLMELANLPNLSANPDLGNLYWGYEVPEEPWYEAIERLVGRVKVWHVKNVQRIRVPEVNHSFFTHAGLGEGDIDYRWALARLMAGGFDGYISIEGAGSGDLLAFAARGKAYLDELLADHEAGIGLKVQ